MHQFILGIRTHNIFQYTVSAYWVDQCIDNSCKIIQNILCQDVKANPNIFTDEQKEIVRLIEEISEQSIYKKFVKKRSISYVNFFNNLDPKLLEEQILPFIGQRIAKIFKLAFWGNIKIFLKPYRYEKVFIDDQLEYVFKPVEPVFYFEKQQNNLKYSLKLLYRKQPLKINQNITFITVQPCHFILNNKIYHIDGFNCKKIKPFLEKEAIIITSKLDTYFEKFVKNTILNYNVVAKGFEIQHIHPIKQAVLTLEQNVFKKWGFTLKFLYDNYEFIPSTPPFKYVELQKINNNYKFIVFNRDLTWEENIIYALKRSGLRLSSSVNFFVYPNEAKSLEDQLLIHINWLNENASLLKDLRIKVIQKTDKQYFTDKIQFNIKVTKKIDWFDIFATVSFGQYQIPFIQLKDYILQGQRQFQLPNGQIAVIPEWWFAKYKNLLLFAKSHKNKNHIKLSLNHFFLLENIDDHNIISEEKIKELINTFKLKNWKIPPVPSSIKAKLRNYQLNGYGWLCTLQNFGFGGCLADDMGLGKTLQVITAIAHALENAKKQNSTQQNNSNSSDLKQTNASLIVVPKSLIHNWLNEFRKFAPKFKILPYIGTNRTKLQTNLSNFDIILSSYGIVRNDIDYFKKFKFLYIVLDESQYIKNPFSKIYRAIKQLHSQHKVVLTGTPIENSLSDLWSQMNFLNPGLLGSYKFFKQNFISPIERSNDQNAKRELKKLISPFILRRTKEEVIKDLPDLVEQTIFCEMTQDQMLLYEAEKSKIRNQILAVYESGKLKDSSIFILRALTRLRQIANHPLMLDPHKNYKSGKFEIVKQKIETVLEEGHKLLIFSSFVKHLQIYEQYFKEKGWKYAMLTGETEMREDVINKFQKNKNLRLFLISLKAGGVGLNLTAADYVFILDPWWNPAAERQAISRAHRIGQNKKVFVYKFITLGTVEQKILQLQQKKYNLFNEFITSINNFAKLSDQNILQLFE